MNPGDEFSELRTGLDHLEFLVERHDDLYAWADRRPAAHGSGVVLLGVVAQAEQAANRLGGRTAAVLAR
jgi:hypothetical protein